MFVLDVEKEEYVLKPMNCPGHILVYKMERRSYRDLPIRYAELGTVYRYERSGTLHGMLRVRGFTQDDGHIFCTPEQLPDEIESAVDFSLFMMNTFGYKDYKVDLSVRDPSEPERYAGTEEEWQRAERVLADVLGGKGISYRRCEGEAVFYGPKIDIKIKDALGRYWQGPTIQFDFNLPRRFDVTYIGEDGKPHYVFMVHRALLGSFERFVGGLIEHYAGAFPVWLSYVQVIVMPITDKQIDYARKVAGELEEFGIRVEVDSRNEKISYKIREAEAKKIPYIVVVGDREVASSTVSVRQRGRKDLGSMDIEQLIDLLQEDIKHRR